MLTMPSDRVEQDRRAYLIIGRDFEEVRSFNRSFQDAVRTELGVNGAGISMVYDDERRERRFTFKVYTQVLLKPERQQELVKRIPPEIPQDIPIELQMSGTIIAANGQMTPVTQRALIIRDQRLEAS